KRHACDPRAVLEAFRALDEPGALGPSSSSARRRGSADAMGAPSFVAVGDLMVDITAAGRGHAARIEIAAGGSAANAAVWAARSGADAAVVGRIGDDLAGRALRSALEERGVRAELTVDPDACTGAFLVVDGEVRVD